MRLACRVLILAAIQLVNLLFSSACTSDGRNLKRLPLPAGARSSAAVPSPGGWLDHLNYYRATACLSPVTENTVWSHGARNHAIYIVKNDVFQHDEDPDNTCFSPEGQIAARQSNLFGGYDTNDTDWSAIDTWMQSPFHALGVLDPRLVQVGYGSYKEADGNLKMGAALNVIAGIRRTAGAAYPIFWPGNGTTIPISLHLGGYPDPLASCPGYRTPSGLPLLVQIGSGDLTPVVSATSFTQEGRSLEHCVFDETTYRNPDGLQQDLGRTILGARDAIVLIPRSPLSAGTTYTASVTVNGQRHTWSFSVEGSRVSFLNRRVRP